MIPSRNPSREELFEYSQAYAVSEIEKELRRKPRKTTFEAFISMLSEDAVQRLIKKYLKEGV